MYQFCIQKIIFWYSDFLDAELSFKNCSSWISRPHTIYQNSWPQTFYRYMLSEKWKLRTTRSCCAVLFKSEQTPFSRAGCSTVVDLDLLLCTGPVFVLARQLCTSAAPKAQPLILQSNPLMVFWNSFRDWLDCQMTGRGLNLDSNLNSAAWPTGSKGFICSEIPE